MAPLKVALFLGSTRPSESLGPMIPGRLAERVAKFLLANLPPDEFDIRVIDPTDDDYKLPLLEIPYHFAKVGKRSISGNLQRLVDTASWAEAFIFVSPEYNHTPGPALINLINHLPPAVYNGPLALKPALLATYSMSKYGGARAVSQLRSLVGEAGCLVCSSVLSIGEANISLDEEGNELADAKGKFPTTEVFVNKCKKEFLFVGRALLTERQQANTSKSTKGSKSKL
jgi:NAD(P)H-dependent FMN reductase